MNEDDNYYYELYDEPEKFRDAPVSLQLVGRNFEDEKVGDLVLRSSCRLSFTLLESDAKLCVFRSSKRLSSSMRRSAFRLQTYRA